MRHLYSSAKDPVNMAGFVADNMLSGKVTLISWRELKDMDRSKVMLVDVRTAEEFAMGSIEGAVNISFGWFTGEYQNYRKIGQSWCSVPSGCGGILQPGY